MDNATGISGRSISHAIIEGYLGAMEARARGKTYVPEGTYEDMINPNSIYSVAHKGAPYQGAEIIVKYNDYGSGGRAYVKDEKGKQYNIQTWPRKM